MDGAGAIGGGGAERDYPVADEPVMEAPPAIGTDERRMHVRAYNFWVSQLAGRRYPAIDELDPANVADFGDHGVVLKLTDVADPDIAFVGAALCEEGGHDTPIHRLAEVPDGSLLSRLTNHIDEILANRAPIGFEAEFVNHRQRNMMYRGILLPFSGDGEVIDAIYGVINWKEALAEPLTATLSAELGRVMREPPVALAMPGPVWADGPNATPFGQPGPFADAPAADEADVSRIYLRHAPARAMLDLTVPGDDEFVVLVARRDGPGRLAVIGDVTEPHIVGGALDHLLP